MIAELRETALDSMSNLSRGWNGYSADPPSTLAIATARLFLRKLDDRLPPARVAPSAAGGVGVAFRDRGRKVYAEFFNDGSICTLYSDLGSEPESREGEPTGETIRRYFAEGRT